MGTGDLVIRIDGERPLTEELVAALAALCDRADDGDRDAVIVHASGAPREPLDASLTVGLVSKWERALRRLERLSVATIALASGDCGGPALETLLATDYRIAAPSVRLLMPLAAGATWPGMVVYRLIQQVGVAAARRAVLFGIPIDAADALTLRLIDELTGDMPSALAAATERAAFLGTEVALRRQLMLEASAVSFEDALGVHLAACDRVLRQLSAQAM